MVRIFYSDEVGKRKLDIIVNYDDADLNDIFHRPFTEEELKASISYLKNGKAGGPDGVLAEIIKATLLQIVPILLLLIW